jgi:hypothetical protein
LRPGDRAAFWKDPPFFYFRKNGFFNPLWLRVPKSATNYLGLLAISMKPSSDFNKRLLSRKTLADRWSMSTATLKKREKDGFLKAIKLGPIIRYRLSDIEALEAAAEVRSWKEVFRNGIPKPMRHADAGRTNNTRRKKRSPAAVLVGPTSEFTDFHGLLLLFGLRRSTAYHLVNTEPALKGASISLRGEHESRGKRLFSVPLFRAYLKSKQGHAEWKDTVWRKCRKGDSSNLRLSVCVQVFRVPNRNSRNPSRRRSQMGSDPPESASAPLGKGRHAGLTGPVEHTSGRAGAQHCWLAMPPPSRTRVWDRWAREALRLFCLWWKSGEPKHFQAFGRHCEAMRSMKGRP